MIVVATVAHSGTRTILSSLPQATAHLFTYEPNIHRMLQTARQAYTTYRDPLHVAISWINNGKTKELHQGGPNGWYAQWEEWSRFAANEKVEVVPVTTLTERLGRRSDPHQLYNMLENEDYSSYFEYIPERAINYARSITCHSRLIH